MKTLYYTKGEALMAAHDAAEQCNGTTRRTSVDDRTRGLEEDDRFVEIVGTWSGECEAVEVLGRDGEQVGVFAWWTEGEEMKTLEFEGYEVRLYATDDEFVLDFGTGNGWARYPRESFTLSKALVDQYFLDCEDVDPEERARIAKSAQEVAE